MNKIQSHTNSFRAAASLTIKSHQQTTTSLKDGNLFLESVGVPSETVSPDGIVRTNATAINGAANIAPLLDRDACSAGAFESNGYQTRIVIDPEWTESRSFSKCFLANVVGVNEWTVSEAFDAPSISGESEIFEIDFWIELPNTNTVSGKVTRTIEVAQGGSTDPPPDEEEEEEDKDKKKEENGPVLPCFLDPNQTCGQLEIFGFGAVLVLILIAFAGR